MANLQSTISNPWNPFLPTPRDIQRTEELSQKSLLISGILSFLFLPAAMIYLGRAVNLVKILGYGLLFAIFLVAMFGFEVVNSKYIGFACNIAVLIEQLNTVHKARQRKIEGN
ncbi:MAG: hypothetical protein AAGA16_11175 [Cyanobacteria bacterium P01_E01_bin.35]